MKRFTVVALSLLFLGTACYHARIETDLPPSNQTIKQPFASSWIYGLVPPKVVETAEECPNGVSRVETKLSFVNGLVAALTFSIYTPMTIEVTCAAAGGSAEAEAVEPEVEIGADATLDEKRQAFTEAARLARERDAPIYVRF